MSFIFTQEKMPDSPEERNKLITESLKYEAYIESLCLSNIQKGLIGFLLINKGFSPEEVEVKRVFSLNLKDLTFNATVDFILKVRGKYLILIQCATCSLDSWERYAIALCRVIDSSLIPYAIITDGESIRFINVDTGNVMVGSIESIPSESECERMFNECNSNSYPEEKSEKEKRIVYAFEGLKYSNLNNP